MFKKIKTIIKNNRGFTLLELLIYVAILAGFLVVITDLFFTVSTSSVRKDVRAEVQQNLRFAVQRITTDVRSASAISVPAGSNSGNTLTLTIDGVETSYGVVGEVLQRTRSAVTENITNEKVAVSTVSPIFARTFSSGARPTIQIVLEISYKDNGRADYIFSDKIQITVSGNELQADMTLVPSQVTGVTTTPSSTQVILSWTAPSDGGNIITSYKAYRSTTSGAETLLAAGGCSSLGNVLTCTDAGLTNGTSYFYKISAVNIIGEGSQSAEANAVPASAPAQVTGLTATKGPSTINLSWTAPSDGGSAITSYKVYRSTTSGAETLLATGGCSSLGNVLTCVDETALGLNYYKVSAVNVIGDGAQSAEVSQTPGIGPI